MACCWEALSPPAGLLSCWCLAARLFTSAQETLQHLQSILLFLQNRCCGAGPLLTGSGSRYLFFTGSSSSSYKNWLTSSKNVFLPSHLYTGSGSDQKSTGSGSTALCRTKECYSLILLRVMGPNLELVPGFADPACSDWLSVYILYYTNGSSNRLLFSTRCCYPIILFSLIRGRPVFISFSGFYFLPEPVKHSDPCGSGSESLFNSSCCCSPVTY